MAALVRGNSHVNDLNDCFDPCGDLLKDVSELDLLTLLVSVQFPSFGKTVCLFAFCGFMNLIHEASISMVDMGFPYHENTVRSKYGKAFTYALQHVNHTRRRFTELCLIFGAKTNQSLFPQVSVIGARPRDIWNVRRRHSNKRRKYL